MVGITSGAELEEWLEDKPRDWAQVIAARAALRVLPYAFASEVPQKWVNDYALSVIRALAISWAARNIPSHYMVTAAAYAVRAAADAADAADAARSAADAARAVRAAAYTADTSYVVRAAADVPYAAASAVGAAGAAARAANVAVWANVSHDCNWLERADDADSDSRLLTQLKLWPAKEVPGWSAAWDDAANRLRSLDQGYDVWIDWYQRRIEGHDAAFDIPGDINRTEDKAILARLADASDEDFWGKGATHVNTTLQSWIDEARIEAQIQEIIRKLRGGASAHYGAQDELDKRAALLAELDRMLGKPPQGRFGIGGNSPPEPIDVPSAPVALPQELRDPIEAISDELEKPEPDALVIAEKAALLHRAFKKLKKMASSAADKAADAFGTAVGTAAGVGLVSYVGLSITGVLPKILDWLAPLIH